MRESEIQQILKGAGFIYFESCNCGGRFQVKYHLPKYKGTRVILYPRHNQFKLQIDYRTKCIAETNLLLSKLQEYELEKDI